MNWLHLTRREVLGIAVTACVLTTGCGGGGGPAVEAKHLRTLVSFYNYAASSRGRAPANEQEFKQFISENGSTAMERLKIESVDAMFVSERDGQPFTVLYGKRPKEVSPEVVAFEKTGVDGTRQVGLRLGMIEDADAARFNELVPPSSGLQ